jgi:hypothetical protein
MRRKMKNEFTLTVTINAKAEKIYEAYLSSEGHTAITAAFCKPGAQRNFHQTRRIQLWKFYWKKVMAKRN